MPQQTTPAEAWRALREGNDRFVAGTVAHPSQDADRRADLSAGQQPFAVLLGCSDSRVAAEIIFDRGLGDLFVVRTAGHVTDATVLGSVEYGVAVLGVPLVVVLGHDSCGAIAATQDYLRTGVEPAGHVRSIVDRVRPSIVDRADATPDEVLTGHVSYTVRALLEDSVAVRAAVAEGRCAVVGTTYRLAEGRVRVVAAHGPVDVADDLPSDPVNEPVNEPENEPENEPTERPDGSI